MVKPIYRFGLDVALYINLGALTVVGLLLAFVIPRGPGRDKDFLGLHRHDWTDIHLWLSLVFIALLVLHVVFNWRWVTTCARRFLGEGWTARMWWIALGPLGLLVLCWLLKVL